MIFDVVIVSLLSYVVFKVINSQKGLRFFGWVAAASVVLVASSYVALPALHLLAQAALVVLLVSFPILFHQEWQAVLDKNTQAPPTVPLSPAIRILLSIGLALLLVGMTVGSSTKVGQLSQEIPIKAVNVPDGMSARVSGDQRVTILISAPREDWRSVTPEAFSATVDVAKQSEGTYDLAVTVTSKVASVKILKIKPSRAFVSVEPVIRKTVPVTVKYSGKAGDDLVPGEAKITPDKVEISGAKSLINDLTQAVVAVKLNGEVKPIEQKATLRVENSSGETLEGVTFTPAEVALTIPLVKAGKVKTVGIKPVLSGQPATGFWVKSVTVSPSTVSVTGPVEQLSLLTDVPTAPLTITGISENTEQQLVLNLPSGITVADTVTKVKVTVTLAKTETTKSINPEIVYVGIDPALKVASISPNAITAIVSGASDILNGLTGAQIKLNLDLSAYKSAGTYSVNIKNTNFTLIDGVSLVSFLPSAIGVTLENR